MFAPKVANAKSQAPASSTTGLPRQSSSPEAAQVPARRTSDRTGNNIGGCSEQQTNPANVAAREAEPRVSWDFSKVPLLPPDRASRSQPPSRPANTAPSGSTQTTPVVGQGRPLDATTRTFFEERLGLDVGLVRVHTDAQANQSAHRLNANAYTVGHDIVFAAGRFAPGTPEGQRVLAHELAHVAQSEVALADPARPASSVDALELEAVQVAGAVRAGNAMPPIRNVARDLGAPLRDGPTFGNLPLDEPEKAGARRVELIKQDGKWKEIAGGRNAPVRTAKGSYDFVIQNGRIWAVRSSSRFGHTEAAEGGRVAWAGQIQFTQSGALKRWDNASGHHLPTAGFAENASRAHPDLPIDMFVATHRGPVTRPATPGGRPAHREGPQLPVFQPETKPRPGATSKADKSGTTPATAPPTTAGPDKPAGMAPRVKSTQPPGGAASSGATLSTQAPGGGGSRPSTAGSGVETAEIARAIASADAQTKRAQAFSARLARYYKAFQSLQQALAVLDAISTAEDLIAHGTALPKEQAEADKVVKESDDAVEQANDTIDEISLLEWTGSVANARRAKDQAALFRIEDALLKIKAPLETAAKSLRDIAGDLTQGSDRMREESRRQYKTATTPQGDSTLPNAVAAALWDATQRLSGRLGTAARNYTEAAATLQSYTDLLNDLANEAEDAAWAIGYERVINAQREIDRRAKAASANPGSTTP
jgi:hypothetical protein